MVFGSAPPCSRAGMARVGAVVGAVVEGVWQLVEGYLRACSDGQKNAKNYLGEIVAEVLTKLIAVRRQRFWANGGTASRERGTIRRAGTGSRGLIGDDRCSTGGGSIGG